MDTYDALGANTDRSYLSVLLPANAELGAISIDGAPAKDVYKGPELGKRFFATDVEVVAGQSKSVVFTYKVPKVVAGGRYQLTVQNQATVHTDRLSVNLTLPDGISVPDGQGPGSTLTWNGGLTSELRLGSSPPVGAATQWAER